MVLNSHRGNIPQDFVDLLLRGVWLWLSRMSAAAFMIETERAGAYEYQGLYSDSFSHYNSTQFSQAVDLTTLWLLC